MKLMVKKKRASPHSNGLNPSTYALILSTVNRLGKCSLAKIVNEVGPSIPAARAAHRQRTQLRWEIAKRNRISVPTPEELVRMGRNLIVVVSLADLVRDKKLQKLEKGVYAPIDYKK